MGPQDRGYRFILTCGRETWRAKYGTLPTGTPADKHIPFLTMPADKPLSDESVSMLEISLPTAQELCRLGLATMIDIRQSFEIDMKGAIPGTVHIPMFEVKVMLGHVLTEDEQEILDAGEPKDIDAKSFFTMINQLHHARDHLLLCICNSGRRSVAAASLLRSLGYPKALSVAGGFQGWKKLQAPSAAATAPVTPPCA